MPQLPPRLREPFRVAICLALLAAAVFVVGSRADAQTTPSITVTPNTGLADTAVVTVTGSGFSPNTTITLLECNQSSIGQGGCGNNAQETQTTDTGALSTTMTVTRTYARSFDGMVIQCENCNVTAVQSGTFSTLATIAFANVTTTTTTTAPPAAVITVTPNTDLAGFEQVTVSGENFGANNTVSIRECKTTFPGGCSARNVQVTTDEAGAFTTTFTAAITFTLIGGSEMVGCGTTTDCNITARVSDGPVDSQTITFLGDTTTTTVAPTTTTLPPNTTTTTPTSAILAQLRAAICPALGTLRNSPLGSLLGPVINSLLNGFGCPNSSLGTRSASTPLSCDELLAARTNIDAARTQLKADRTLSRTARNALLNQLASLRSSLNKQIRLQKCSQPAAQGVTAQSVTPATYTVQRGDSLSSIAQHLLGDGNLYTQLFALNRDQITNPSLIYRGQILRLPALA